MTGRFEKSIKTKRAMIEIHRLQHYVWDNSKFSGRQTLNIIYTVRQEMALQSEKSKLWNFPHMHHVQQ